MVSFRVFNNYLSIGLVIGLNVLQLAVAQLELKLVNVLFRHGDRTPDDNGYELYPNDPYLNYSFYPAGLGQLTIEGKMREYVLGQVLHSRYKNFLGDLYLPKLAVAHSSDYDRTKMSLQLVLTALFPPGVRQWWNPALNWQPIPTSYVTRVDDNFFLPDECPQFLDEYDRAMNLPKTQKKMSEFTNLMNKLTKLTGKKIEKPMDMYYLYHTFTAESFLNLTLPKWTYDYFPDGPLLDGIVAAYDIAHSTPLLKRLFAGRLIRTISENMLAAQNASKNTKIYLYSGHETNIVTLLHALNVYKPHVPEYSSAVILELLQQNNQYYVKILYYRGIPSIINELKIPGCEIICPFDKFLDLIRDLIPSDREMVCDKRQTVDYAGTKYLAALENDVYNLIIKSFYRWS